MRTSSSTPSASGPVPRNDVSLRFHARRGYREVGRLGDEQHLVSLMEKVL